ncbi:neprilysin-like isoform X2 [Rhodnius prolixus]
MNLSADPCTDFFEFACGGWTKAHPVPKTESHWNQFNLVDEKLNLQLREILDLPINSDDSYPVKNAKRFYKVCMEEESAYGSENPLKKLKSLLKTFGSWPIASYPWRGGGSFVWSDVLADITRTLVVWPIIYVAVSGDRKNSTRHVITIDQPSLVVPRTMLSDVITYKHQIEAYKTWVRETAILLAKVSGQRVDLVAIGIQAEEIVNFESELAKIMSTREMRRNVLRTYNAMTLRELQSWTDMSAPGQINWLRLVERIFQETEVNVNWSMSVVVREVDYLFKLVKLIRDTPTKVLANYLNWRVVKFFSRELNDDMRKLAFQFEQVFTGATMDQPRWKECLQSTDGAMNMAVGYIYAKKYFDNAAKQVAEVMSANIKAVFSEQMDNLSWMDEETKKAAKIKVDTMSQLIGYPAWYDNSTALEHYYDGLSIDDSHFDNVRNARSFNSLKMLKKLGEPTERSEWPISPGVVNAYYNSQTNSIIFPAGILQPPFFSKKRTEALNYGGIGVVIGHEITHGFDDVGRHSDAHGNLAQWWSEETIQTYLEKAECFISQYGSYRIPVLDSTLLTKVTVNGVTTLGENIADNGGLHSALLAYRKYEAKNGPEPRLPGLEQYSPEQLFFIAFATNWCESSTKESLLHEVLNDPHSPHKFRVQGSLENSVEFTKAFNCPSQAEKQVCTIW